MITRLNDKYENDSIFMQSCINFLIQRINDHKVSINRVEIQVELIKWVDYTLKKYSSYSDTKKILQNVSDIYVITGGSCEITPDMFTEIMDRLGLSEVKISPDDFAKEIVQDPTCLPLYIKDVMHHNDMQTDVSSYGGIIYQIYDLARDQNIQDLAAAKNEDMNTLCQPLIKKSIMDRNIRAMSAQDICCHLLDDMKRAHARVEQKRLQKIENEERKKCEIEERREREKKEEELRRRKEKEAQKKYSLSVLSSSYLVTCSLESYVEESLNVTNDYGIDENDMAHVKRWISEFSPAVMVMTDGISKKELGIQYSNMHIVSLADFYFCQWRSREQNKNIRYVALLDYYKHKLHVSCYSFDDAGKIRKADPFTIKHNKTKNNIIKAIKENELFSGIPEEEIALYRIFESERNIDKKLEKVDVPLLDKDGLWRGSLKDTKKRKETIDCLYDFQQMLS